MGVWWILLSKLRKHSLYHLFIPLAGGVIGELVVDVVWTDSKRWFGFAAGVLLSYSIVMVFLITKETKQRIDVRTLVKLQDELDHAQSYYGLSIIPITEWFDPAIQVYLAKLFNRKLDPDDFEHERTLLFFSKREFKNSQLELTDEHHHGRCLAHMHADCDIPLSFLQRHDIFALLKEFGPEELEALGCYPRLLNWRPLHFLRGIPLHWLRRRRIRGLDFGIVTKADGQTEVLRISKDGEEVRIADKFGAPRADPYLKLARLIKAKVYENQKLSTDYDFVAGYGFPNRKPRQLSLPIVQNKLTPSGRNNPPETPTIPARVPGVIH